MINCLNNERIQLPEEIFKGYCDHTVNFIECKNGVLIGHNPYIESSDWVYFDLKTKSVEKFKSSFINKVYVFWNNN